MADPLAKFLGGSSKEDEEESGESATEEAPEIDAAKDIIAAVKASDPKALSLALERHYEACKGSDEPTDEDDSGDY